MTDMISVLLVDDEEHLLKASTEFLNRTGDIIVTGVPRVKDAINLLNSRKFDVIVSDYQMGEMNGIEFLKYLKSTGDPTPFILFTGKSREDIAIEALNNGASFYLQKGDSIKAVFAELVSKIKAAASHSRAVEELKRKSEEIREQYSALKKSEEDLRNTSDLLENLINIAQSPIIIWDPSFHIIRLNRVCENLIGRRAEDVIGLPVELLFSPGQAERTRRLFQAIHDGARWETTELDLIHQDGSVRNILWNTSTLYAADGITHVATIAQGNDVTDELKLKLEKDAALAQIQKNLAQLAILNDEIRNPLMVILTCADEMGSGGYVDQIFLQTQRINEMVTNLDKRWIESEKVLRAIRKHYQIEPFKTTDFRDDTESDLPGMPERDTSLIEEVKARLFTILDSIDAMVYVADMETHELLYTNQQGRAMLGNILGKKCYQTVYPGFEKPCQFCTNRFLTTNGEPTGVYRWEFQNKEDGRWYDCRDRAIRWNDGRLVHLTISTDITERRESQTRFERYIETAPEGILLADEKGNYQFVNDAACSMTGYPREELLQKNMITLIYPEDIPLATAHFQKVVETGQASGEARFVTRSGEVRWWVVKAVRLSPVQFLGFTSDITERKRAEEAISRDIDAMKVLLKLSSMNTTAADLSQLLTEIVDAAIAITCADFGNIQLVDSKTNNLRIVAHRNLPGCWLAFWDTVSEGKGTCGIALENADRVIVPDIEESLIFAGTPALEIHRRAGIRAVQSTPLINREGRVLGIFSTHFKKPHKPDERQIRLLDLLAREAANMIDRKWAEEALAKSEEKYRSLFDNAILGVYRTTPEGRYLDMNTAFARIAGFDSPEEMMEVIHDIGKQLYVHPEDRQKIGDLLTLHGEIRNFETEIRRRDGQSIWIAINSKGVRDENGSILWWEGTIEEISARKRAEFELIQKEKALQESRDLLDETQKITRVGGWEWDVGKQRMNWTDETYRIHGMVPGDIPPGSPEHMDRSLACYDIDDQSVIKAAFRRCVDEGEGYDLEFPLTRVDGHRIWIRTIAHPVKEGVRIVRVLGNIMDITENREIREALRHSEERLRLAHKATNDVVWDWDVLSDTQQWNEAGTKVFGWTEIVEKPVSAQWWVDRVHPDDRDRVHDGFFAVVNDPTNDVWSDEYRFLKTDGTYADVMDRGYVLRDEQGQAYRMIGAMLDITERKCSELASVKSEEKYRLLFENIGEGVIFSSPDGLIHAANPAACSILGFTEEELSKLGMNGIIDTSDINLIPALKGREQTGEFKGELTFIQKEGTKFPVFVTTNMFTDSTGNIRTVFLFQDISKSKQLLQRIQDAREAQSAMLNSITESAFMMTPDGTVLAANDTSAQRIGFQNHEELIGKNVYDLLPGDVATGRRKNVSAVMNSGRSLQFEDERSGHRILNSVYPVIEPDGTVSRLAIFGIDITDRLQAEDALYESERNYREIFNSTSEAIMIDDASNGKIIDVNNTTLRMYGYDSKEEILAGNIGDLSANIPPYDEEEAQRRIVRCIEEEPQVFEWLAKKKNGEIFWIEVSLRKTEIGGKGRILAVVRDISRRKLAEERLRESEERFRSILQDVTTVAVQGYAMDGTVRYWNRASETFYGYTPEEALHQNLLDLIIPPDMREGVRSAITNMAETGEAIPASELGLMRKDGSIIPVYSSHVIVRVPGKDAELYCIDIDLSDRKRAEEALYASNQKLRLLSSLTRHDVTNQLAAIHMLYDLISVESDPVKKDEFLIASRQAVEQVESIIRFTQKYEDFGIVTSRWHQIQSLIESAASETMHRGIIIKQSIPPEIHIFADPIIKKVFSNIIDNAVRHAGEFTRIQFSCLKAGRDIIIVCEDDGCGVPQEEKDRIFEHGYGRNTGLGLFLSREILAITGLSIRETGVPGTGARFEIMVPEMKWRRDK